MARCEYYFPALRNYRAMTEQCDLETIGVWSALQEIMHEAYEAGHPEGYLLTESGQPITVEELAKRLRIQARKCSNFVQTLLKTGLLECDENGTFSAPWLRRKSHYSKVGRDNRSKRKDLAYKQAAQPPTTSQQAALQTEFVAQTPTQTVPQSVPLRKDNIYIQESSSRDSSVVVSPSATPKTIPQNQKSKTPEPQAPRIVPPLQMDSKFFEFRQAAEARSIRGTELQWTAAYEEYWSKMPLAERIRAKNGLQFREPTEKTEPKFLANPIKYLSSKAWEKYDDLPKPGQPANKQPEKSPADLKREAEIAQAKRVARFYEEHPDLIDHPDFRDEFQQIAAQMKSFGLSMNMREVARVH